MFWKKKGIPVELDKKRYLRLELQGMVAFEVATKKPVFLPATIEKLEPREIGVLLWCCLTHEGLSLEQVQQIVSGLDERQFAELSEKLPIAWRDGQK